MNPIHEPQASPAAQASNDQEAANQLARLAVLDHGLAIVVAEQGCSEPGARLMITRWAALAGYDYVRLLERIEAARARAIGQAMDAWITAQLTRVAG